MYGDLNHSPDIVIRDRATNQLQRYIKLIPKLCPNCAQNLCLLHTVEVTSSNPVSPTILWSRTYLILCLQKVQVKPKYG